MTMECRTDAPTIVNLVHHSYFNLAGHDAGDVLGHEVTLDSDFYTPVDDELLATGEILVCRRHALRLPPRRDDRLADRRGSVLRRRQTRGRGAAMTTTGSCAVSLAS